jgi:pimeloyl-ACP methyl ester carboxylesterase
VAGTSGNRAAQIGALAGALAAGVAAGLVAERRVVHRRTQVPGEAPQLPPGRESLVIATDGVPLHVEEDGPPDAPLTIVFAHGYTLRAECWAFQREALRERARLVFYDQRSHGQSGRSDAENCTVEQLGADLERVLEERVPSGPVVLVGHSMGGMTIMSLADQRPDLFGRRVVAAALLSTSAGKLASVTFGLPALAGVALQRALPRVSVGLGRREQLFERARRGGSDLSYAMTRHLSFATPVPTDVLDLMDRMISDTSVGVISAFAPELLRHDKLAALPVLKSIPTLILVGDKDVLTPPEHSEAIAEALPEAKHVVVPDSGHMVILEHPDVVNQHLRELIREVGG